MHTTPFTSETKSLAGLSVRNQPLGRPHVVILGGGFGGLTTAKALGRTAVDVTLIDRNNHHLFQPLLYQVATAALSVAEIAYPIRSVLSRYCNTTVQLGEASSVDLRQRRVSLRDGDQISYDYLVVATGATTNYFGHETWARDALGLKCADDALEIRRRVLLAFEAAEHDSGLHHRKRLLTFVVVGGGPTGVELAGAIAELACYSLVRDFRLVDTRSARVVLLEAGHRILPTFPQVLADKARADLEELGVRVRTKARVTGIDTEGVLLADERIPSAVVVWAAGVKPTRLGTTLGVPLDRQSRVLVEPDLSVPGHPEVFVIGDMAAFIHQSGKPLPGVAPVAMQEGRAVARSIRNSLRGKPREPFRYRSRGDLATIGRSRAVADLGKIRFNGLFAWLAWVVVHIWYLIGFRNRIVVLFTWLWSYATFRRGARVVTGLDIPPSVTPSAEQAPVMATEPLPRWTESTAPSAV